MTVRLLALGGTPRSGSSTEQLLASVVQVASSMGAHVDFFGGEFLARLPLYMTQSADQNKAAQAFIECARLADGVILASPGWHGSISGSMKNALDYLEETARDDSPYFNGRPVGLIATAYGWQAAVTTLDAMRTIVHALRGWPTPLGVAANCSQPLFENDAISNPALAKQLNELCRQVLSFSSPAPLSGVQAEPVQ
jgi:FMN reductase